MGFRATTQLPHGCIFSGSNLRCGACGQCANDSVVAVPPSRSSRRSGSSICTQRLFRAAATKEGRKQQVHASDAISLRTSKRQAFFVYSKTTGHLALFPMYPASSVHKVAPVTPRALFAAIFWIQSMVRDDHQRDLLCELHASVQALTTQLGGHHRQVIRLSGFCHNLLRLWATPVSRITRITNNALGVIF